MTELDPCEEYSLLEIAYLAAEQRGTDLDERREIFDGLVGHARDCDACGRRFLQLMGERERKRERLAMQAEQDAADAALAETVSADTPVEAAPEPAKEPLLARIARELGLLVARPVKLGVVLGSSCRVEYDWSGMDSPVSGGLWWEYDTQRERTVFNISANPSSSPADYHDVRVGIMTPTGSYYVPMERAGDIYSAPVEGEFVQPDRLDRAPWIAWEAE